MGVVEKKMFLKHKLLYLMNLLTLFIYLCNSIPTLLAQLNEINGENIDGLDQNVSSSDLSIGNPNLIEQNISMVINWRKNFR